MDRYTKHVYWEISTLWHVDYLDCAMHVIHGIFCGCGSIIVINLIECTHLMCVVGLQAHCATRSFANQGWAEINFHIFSIQYERGNIRLRISRAEDPLSRDWRSCKIHLSCTRFWHIRFLRTHSQYPRIISAALTKKSRIHTHAHVWEMVSSGPVYTVKYVRCQVEVLHAHI